MLPRLAGHLRQVSPPLGRARRAGDGRRQTKEARAGAASPLDPFPDPWDPPFSHGIVKTPEQVAMCVVGPIGASPVSG